MPGIRKSSLRCFFRPASSSERLIMLLSDGGSWLMMPSRIGSLRWVMQFTLNTGRVASARHVAGELAERAFRFERIGQNFAFDDDLRVRRHFEIDGLAAHQRDRLAPDAARDRELVGAVARGRDDVLQPGRRR